MPDDKSVFLKSIRLFEKIPAEQLESLSQFLKEEKHSDGAVVFEEGQPGNCLYIISTGNIVIAKKLRSDEDASNGVDRKELAVLGPGDCFGEMSLLEADQPRSADALARGETVLARLDRDELNTWLAGHPQLAIAFFAELVSTLSGRLRISSNELTLLFDLSSLLLEPFSSVRDLFDKFMRRRMRYLEGDWCSGAYHYNEFNDEMDLVDVEGDFNAVKDSIKIPPPGSKDHWIDDNTYQVLFPGPKRCLGYIVFHRKEPLDAEEKNETARTLTTTARLLTSALVQLNFRLENEMRERLSASRQMGEL